MYTTLITPEQLQSLQREGMRHMVFDCSFDLMQPEAGAQQYAQTHIAGAVYARLDRDLSARHGAPGNHGIEVAHGADTPASGGRHPLPNREKFAIWLSGVGFANDMQAVVYDRNGANHCGRLWWMLKWSGHEAVAVLDGGLAGWQAAGGTVRGGEEASHFQTNFALGAPLARLVAADDVLAGLGDARQTVVDARSGPRYRGETEPLDPVAGHIPGALNRPFSENLGADGRFKTPAQLRQEFEVLLGARSAASVVHQCGSGVSAVPNLLAMELAGLGRAALYAGSWSDWCSDPRRPVERG